MRGVEMISAAKSSRTNYKSLLKNVQANIKKCAAEYQLDFNKSLWLPEAIKRVNVLNRNLKNPDKLKKLFENPVINPRYLSSLYNLEELNLILANLQLIETGNKTVIKKKLKEILNMPLRMLEEEHPKGTNQGRDSLFELRLAIRLGIAGYKVSLFHDHPDILFEVGNTEYAVECKRISKEERFEKDLQVSVGQLEKYSLKGNSRLGLPAISVTRAFHNGDKMLASTSEQKLSEQTDVEIKRFYEKHKQEIFDASIVRTPAIIVEFSDVGVIDIPYWINIIYIIEARDYNQFSMIGKVQKDLQGLVDAAGRENN